MLVARFDTTARSIRCSEPEASSPRRSERRRIWAFGATIAPGGAIVVSGAAFRRPRIATSSSLATSPTGSRTRRTGGVVTTTLGTRGRSTGRRRAAGRQDETVAGNALVSGSFERFFVARHSRERRPSIRLRRRRRRSGHRARPRRGAGRAARQPDAKIVAAGFATFAVEAVALTRYFRRRIAAHDYVDQHHHLGAGQHDEQQHELSSTSTSNSAHSTTITTATSTTMTTSTTSETMPTTTSRRRPRIRRAAPRRATTSSTSTSSPPARASPRARARTPAKSATERSAATCPDDRGLRDWRRPRRSSTLTR
mgnify:CR=1 FL=1